MEQVIPMRQCLISNMYLRLYVLINNISHLYYVIKLIYLMKRTFFCAVNPKKHNMNRQTFTLILKHLVAIGIETNQIRIIIPSIIKPI